MCKGSFQVPICGLCILQPFSPGIANLPITNKSEAECTSPPAPLSQLLRTHKTHLDPIPTLYSKHVFLYEILNGVPIHNPLESLHKPRQNKSHLTQNHLLRRTNPPPSQKRHISPSRSQMSLDPALGTEDFGVRSPYARISLHDAEVGVNVGAREDEDGGGPIGAAATGEGSGVSACATRDGGGCEEAETYVREKVEA